MRETEPSGSDVRPETELHATPEERRLAEVSGEAAQLREQLRTLGEFLANLSHELATPLTPLVGYLRLLSSGRLGPLTDKQKQVLEAMVHASERLERSIDNLVDYASLGSGKHRVEKRAFDASKMLDETIAELNPKARVRHVRFDVRRPDSLMIFGDEKRVRQAFGNVLDNAIRFSPHGGHVLVFLTESPERVVFAVYDQGPGMTEEQRTLAVQPSRKTHDRASGTGLGLPVAKQIIESHGGALWLESPPHLQPDARELFPGTMVAFWVPHPPR